MKNLSANTAKYSLIQANDATGLHIQDDGGNGLFIKDGGNIGIGTSAPDVKLAVVGATSANAYTFYQNTLTDASEAIHRPTTGQLAIRANSQERVRIDVNGNVGIGTSSPDATLHVQANDNSVDALAFWVVNKAHTNSIISAYENGRVQIGQFTYEDDTGNVGIGTVIPDVRLVVADNHPGDDVALRVWNSSTTDNSTASLRFTNTSSTNYDHGYIIAGRTPSPYMQFGVADSVTAMHIDGTGNVGIGTTDPSLAKLQIEGDNDLLRLISTRGGNGGAEIALVQNSDSPANEDAHGMINFIGNDTDNANPLSKTFSSIRGITHDALNSKGRIGFFTRNGGAFEEALSVTAGSVGVGTTSPDYTLEVKKSVENWVSRIYNTRSTTGSAGLLVRSDASDFDSHAFGVHAGGSYKLSVRCDGKIGMGTISPLDILHVNGNITIGGDQAYSYIRPPVAGMAIKMGAHTATWDRDFYIGHSDNNRVFSPYLYIKAEGQSMMHGSNIIGDNVNGAGEILTGGGAIIIQNHTSHGDQSLFLVKTGSSKNLRMQIKCDGDLENINNSYSGISDIKLKENIIDANSQWEDIKSLQVRNYNFKPDTGYHDNKQIGLIAQEVEETCPGLVGVSIDEHTDVETKSVKYSVLYMKAVKALQEAMQRIETLEQRIDTLENK